MEATFWISVSVIAYVYVGYPALAWLLARIVGQGIARSEIMPTVTVITAAFNEARHIEATVRNKLGQEYPEELLDVIVVSDESTDGTDRIVENIGGRVQLLRQEPRAGKTAALSLAVERAQGEILIFSDANSIYEKNAIRQLVANFSDPDVGYVTGKMVYVNKDGSMVGDGCSAYMKYENWLRSQETLLASVVGVDGGIDAARKELFTPMRADQLPDFVLPLLIAEKGYKVVYEPTAVLQEESLGDPADEYRMRVRVSLRALWALWDLRRLMNPFKHGLLALQLISHKLLRYLAFGFLLAALLSNILLLQDGTLYLFTMVTQALLYSIAICVALARQHPASGILALPHYFLLINVAAAHAAMLFLRGERKATWTPRGG